MNLDFLDKLAESVVSEQRADGEFTVKEFAERAREKGADMTDRQAKSVLSRSESSGAVSSRLIPINGRMTRVYREAKR